MVRYYRADVIKKFGRLTTLLLYVYKFRYRVPVVIYKTNKYRQVAFPPTFVCQAQRLFQPNTLIGYIYL